MVEGQCAALVSTSYRMILKGGQTLGMRWVTIEDDACSFSLF